jgi:4a-hydroxytetrahydrobiopterin dehydratase
MDDLASKRCVPCEGGTKPLSTEAIAGYRSSVPDWHVNEDELSISRSFRFGDFKEAIGFVNEVADIAEFEGHHPDILVYGYRNVRITLSTHAIKGLSENDFILAAKIDQIDRI